MTIVLVCKIQISLTSHHTLHIDTQPRADANQNLTRLYVPSCHFSLVNIVAPRPSNMFSAKGVLCVHQLGLPPIIQIKPLQDYLFTHFWKIFKLNVYNADYRRTNTFFLNYACTGKHNVER